MEAAIAMSAVAGLSQERCDELEIPEMHLAKGQQRENNLPTPIGSTGTLSTLGGIVNHPAWPGGRLYRALTSNAKSSS